MHGHQLPTQQKEQGVRREIRGEEKYIKYKCFLSFCIKNINFKCEFILNPLFSEEMGLPLGKEV